MHRCDTKKKTTKNGTETLTHAATAHEKKRKTEGKLKLLPLPRMSNREEISEAAKLN